MCIICRKEYKEDITGELRLNCPDVEEIPYLPLLESLRCIDCHNLKKIPSLPLLGKLCLTRCSIIETIPDLPSLIFLFCDDCSLLKNISMFPLLIRSYIFNCPLILSLPSFPLFPTLGNWCTDNCKWLNYGSSKTGIIKKIQKRWKTKYRNKLNENLKGILTNDTRTVLSMFI